MRTVYIIIRRDVLNLLAEIEVDIPSMTVYGLKIQRKVQWLSPKYQTHKQEALMRQPHQKLKMQELLEKSWIKLIVKEKEGLSLICMLFNRRKVMFLLRRTEHKHLEALFIIILFKPGLQPVSQTLYNHGVPFHIIFIYLHSNYLLG